MSMIPGNVTIPASVRNPNCPSFLCITSPRYRSVAIASGSGEAVVDGIEARDMANEFDLPWAVIKAVCDKAKVETFKRYGRTYYDFDAAEKAIAEYGPPEGTLIMKEFRSRSGLNDDQFHRALAEGVFSLAYAIADCRYFWERDISAAWRWAKEEIRLRKEKREQERRAFAEKQRKATPFKSTETTRIQKRAAPQKKPVMTRSERAVIINAVLAEGFMLAGDAAKALGMSRQHFYEIAPRLKLTERMVDGVERRFYSKAEIEAILAMTPSDAMTVHEAAKFLGVHETYMYRIISRVRTYKRPGNRTLYLNREDVQRCKRDGVGAKNGELFENA